MDIFNVYSVTTVSKNEEFRLGAETGDYSNGPSIAYFPVGEDEFTLEQVLHHEAGGHGFSKLADEYAYPDI